MQQKLPSTLYIFSVDRTEVDSLQNLKNQGLAAQVLSDAGVPYSLCEGSYNGAREVSFCAYLPANPDSVVYEEYESVVLELCRRFNQESYLQVSPEHTGRLVFLADDRIQSLGKVTFSVETPVAASFTKFPSGNYLTVG